MKNTIIFFLLLNINITWSKSTVDYLHILSKVPHDHPRVYLRPQDIIRLREKIQLPEFKNKWDSIKKSNHPLCKAFEYLITNDKIIGRASIDNGFEILKESIDGRRIDSPFHYCACIYDWCYPLLTEKEKDNFIKEFKRLASSHSPFYPAKDKAKSFVCGHIMEGWLLTGQLPAGLAIYEKDTIMFKASIILFFNKYLPTFNFHYKALMHHQGASYISRFMHDIFAAWLLRSITLEQVFNKNQHYVPYQLLYHLRSDFKQLHTGDVYDPNYVSIGKRMITVLTGSFYNDPYLLEYASMINRKFTDLENVFYLICSDDSRNTKNLNELPHSKYFPSPMGEVIHRTGWNISLKSDDAIIQMRIGEYEFGNHQRKDFGTFQIFYKGILTMPSGFYGLYGTEHFKNFQHQSISQNSLLIYDPSEKQNYRGSLVANDGGQRWKKYGICPLDSSDLASNFKMGSVLSYQIGKDQNKYSYSYISGDITDAYSDKISKVTRSMVTFNTDTLDDTYPIVFMVFDRITSKKKDFKKTWLMHSLKEPAILKKRMIIINDLPYYNRKGDFDKSLGFYNGKLIADCLLPKKPLINKVGGLGKEFWIESAGKNFHQSKKSIRHYGRDTISAAFEVGSWRLEVSPSIPLKKDHFLHAMAVMDKGIPLKEKAILIEKDKVYGAKLLGKSAIFSKTGDLLGELEINLGYIPLDVLFCDLLPGLWGIKNEDIPEFTQTVSDTGNCLFIEDLKGKVFLSKKITLSELSGKNR